MMQGVQYKKWCQYLKPLIGGEVFEKQYDLKICDLLTPGMGTQKRRKNSPQESQGTCAVTDRFFVQPLAASEKESDSSTYEMH